MGSPWFNMEGEVVGVASWEVKDETDRFSVGFAVPASSVRAVAEYVKMKGREEPIVMDSWVDGHVYYGQDHCYRFTAFLPLSSGYLAQHF